MCKYKCNVKLNKEIVEFLKYVPLLHNLSGTNNKIVLYTFTLNIPSDLR